MLFHLSIVCEHTPAGLNIGELKFTTHDNLEEYAVSSSDLNKIANHVKVAKAERLLAERVAAARTKGWQKKFKAAVKRTRKRMKTGAASAAAAAKRKELAALKRAKRGASHWMRLHRQHARKAINRTKGWQKKFKAAAKRTRKRMKTAAGLARLLDMAAAKAAAVVKRKRLLVERSIKAQTKAVAKHRKRGGQAVQDELTKFHQAVQTLAEHIKTNWVSGSLDTQKRARKNVLRHNVACRRQKALRAIREKKKCKAIRDRRIKALKAAKAAKCALFHLKRKAKTVLREFYIQAVATFRSGKGKTKRKTKRKFQQSVDEVNSPKKRKFQQCSPKKRKFQQQINSPKKRRKYL
jgi:hypothetical protein